MITHRENLLSVITGETVERLPWVLRIDLWYNAQKNAAPIRRALKEWWSKISTADDPRRHPGNTVVGKVLDLGRS